MRETLKMIRERLTPLYGQGETQAISRLIFRYLKGWSTVDMLMNEDKELSPYIRGEVEKIVERLERHEPIQYITGIAPFHGLMLKVRPGVLIPRPETETLVDMIVDAYRDREDLRILDICTGSGCIALALSRALKFPQISALDASHDALKIARENAADLKAHIKFIEADIFNYTPARESLDLIVSNPPYIGKSEIVDMEPNVIKYEPAMALFVDDDDPLVFYRRICEIAIEVLVGGGSIWFEINPLHADDLKKMIEKFGFADVEIRNDIHGRARFANAIKPKER